MFIRNPSCIDIDSVILTDDIFKDYLQELGFYPLSILNEMWMFSKTDDLLNIINIHGKEVNNQWTKKKLSPFQLIKFKHWKK